MKLRYNKIDMKIKTFRYGVHPEERKELSKNAPIAAVLPGERVAVPMSQHIGAPAEPVVKVGDRVKAGSLIGRATAIVSANVFSSVSGTVAALEMKEGVSGAKCLHVVIENDFKYEEERLAMLTDPGREEIIARAREAGIVGMGGAAFPFDVKLSVKNPVDILLINGSECEPYITCDYRLMLERAEGVVSGVKLVRKALGAKRAVIAVEANKRDAFDALQRYAAAEGIETALVKTKYPQGGEKQLIYALTKRKVPAGKLPGDVGCIVTNAATAYALYEAVVFGKPLYERVVTVSGLAAARPGNFSVRTGTSFKYLAERAGIASDFVKAVQGGPMMGVSMHSLEPSVTKSSGALLLLTEGEIRAVEPTPCINCARCANVCPMSLMPMKTDALILKDKTEETKKYHPELCIECGSCAYVCPAKRPLVQSQRLAKKLILNRERR